jgi:tetratricopeptide (TPR) repeat protein
VTCGLHEIAQFGKRSHAEELLKLGSICYDKREYDKAIEYYTKATRLDPMFAMTYYNRGIA